jgi:hypothetical protein
MGAAHHVGADIDNVRGCGQHGEQAWLPRKSLAGSPAKINSNKALF